MTGSLQAKKGKYYSILNLRDEIGNRKQKVIPLNIKAIPGNKRAAEKRHREVLTEYDVYEKKHINIFTREILFCDFVNIWLEDAKSRLELITFEAYQSYINLHIYPYFQQLGVCLRDLAYHHIKGYYATKEKTLSGNSLKKHHCVISQTLKKAVQMGLILSNPAAEITLPKAKKFTGNFLSIEQGNKLLEISKGTPIEPAIVLAIMYGLRRSEIAGLKWSAIDFTNDTLIIEHTITKFKTEIARDGTKNDSSHRIFPLNSAAKAFLKNLYTKQQEDKLLLGKGYADTPYVCRWADGRQMRCDYLSYAFNRLLKKHNLPMIRLHDLRHCCASYILKMGFSMKLAADWLGHSDIKTTMNCYAHLDFEEKQNVANSFASVLSF